MSVYHVGWPTDEDGDTLFFVDCTKEEAEQIQKWMWEDRADGDLIKEGWIGPVKADTFEEFLEASGMGDDDDD